MEKPEIKKLQVWVLFVLVSYFTAPWLMEFWIHHLRPATFPYSAAILVSSSSRLILLLSLVFCSQKEKRLLLLLTQSFCLANALFVFVILTNPFSSGGEIFEGSNRFAAESFGIESFILLFNTIFHPIGIQVDTSLEGFHLKLGFWRDLSRWLLLLTWVVLLMASFAMLAKALLFFIGRKSDNRDLTWQPGFEWWCAFILTSACFWSYQHTWVATEATVIDSLKEMAKQIRVNLLYSTPIIVLLIIYFKKYRAKTS